MKFYKLEFLKHETYKHPKIEFVYDCSWSPTKTVIGIQLVLEKHLFSVIF